MVHQRQGSWVYRCGIGPLLLVSLGMMIELKSQWAALALVTTTTATTTTRPFRSSRTTSTRPGWLLPPPPPQRASYHSKLEALPSSTTVVGQGLEWYQIMVAGSLAGALGIGVAYPLEALKTKHVLAQQQQQEEHKELCTTSTPLQSSTTTARTWIYPSRQNDTSLALVPPTRTTTTTTFTTGTAALLVPANNNALSSSDSFSTSWDNAAQEFTSLFAGVQTMMMGHAVIKAVTFTVNAMALDYLHSTAGFLQDWTERDIMFAAAACAGFFSSFIVTPVERICSLLQAQAVTSPDDDNDDNNARGHVVTQSTLVDEHSDDMSSDWACIQHVIAHEGLLGWLGKGWTLSLFREVPSEMIYFGFYGLSWSTVAGSSGSSVSVSSWYLPLVLGALVGMASWIPVYPIDVVKTIYQAQPPPPQQQEQEGETATAGSSSALPWRSPWDMTMDLWDQGGITAFVQGLDFKLMCAAVHHAMIWGTFTMLVQLMTDSQSSFV